MRAEATRLVGSKAQGAGGARREVSPSMVSHRLVYAILYYTGQVCGVVCVEQIGDT